VWARMPDEDDNSNFDESDEMADFYDISQGDQIRVDINGCPVGFDFDNLDSCEFHDIDHDDYPDYADARLIYAEYNGVPCTDDQLEWIESNYSVNLYLIMTGMMI